MSDFDILYQHFLKNEIKNRDKAIELLEKRDFDKLQRYHVHYFTKKKKEMFLIETENDDTSECMHYLILLIISCML